MGCSGGDSRENRMGRLNFKLQALTLLPTAWDFDKGSIVCHHSNL